MTDEQTPYFAIVELMGHVRMAGRVSEVERYGAKVGRIDIPDGDGWRTQFFGGGSLYRETPCTEEVARTVASQCMPEPVGVWEMPRQRALPEPEEMDDAEAGHLHCPDCGEPEGACRCAGMADDDTTASGLGRPADEGGDAEEEDPVAAAFHEDCGDR